MVCVMVKKFNMLHSDGQEVFCGLRDGPEASIQVVIFFKHWFKLEHDSRTIQYTSNDNVMISSVK